MAIQPVPPRALPQRQEARAPQVPANGSLYLLNSRKFIHVILIQAPNEGPSIQGLPHCLEISTFFSRRLNVTQQYGKTLIAENTDSTHPDFRKQFSGIFQNDFNRNLHLLFAEHANTDQYIEVSPQGFRQLKPSSITPDVVVLTKVAETNRSLNAPINALPNQPQQPVTQQPLELRLEQHMKQQLELEFQKQQQLLLADTHNHCVHVVQLKQPSTENPLESTYYLRVSANGSQVIRPLFRKGQTVVVEKIASFQARHPGEAVFYPAVAHRFFETSPSKKPFYLQVLPQGFTELTLSTTTPDVVVLEISPVLPSIFAAATFSAANAAAAAAASSSSRAAAASSSAAATAAGAGFSFNGAALLPVRAAAAASSAAATAAGAGFSFNGAALLPVRAAAAASSAAATASGAGFSFNGAGPLLVSAAPRATVPSGSNAVTAAPLQARAPATLTVPATLRAPATLTVPATLRAPAAASTMAMALAAANSAAAAAAASSSAGSAAAASLLANRHAAEQAGASRPATLPAQTHLAESNKRSLAEFSTASTALAPTSSEAKRSASSAAVANSVANGSSHLATQAPASAASTHL